MLLLAHIDVVEAKREDWVRDPFTLVEENGNFYARGALDDKAEAAIWVDTLIRLRQENFRPKRSLKLALTCGEETSGAFNGAEWLVNHRRDLIEAAFAINEGAIGELSAIRHAAGTANGSSAIQKMAEVIAVLVEKGFAYRADDGSYYFRIAKFPAYGKLSKKDFAGMEDGARVDLDEYDKDSARDFALWKAPKPGEASWDTVIGPGRPGWHVECSVMSMEQRGENYDLHAGGEDLIFPHHENEIAQSESFTGKPFARFWFHTRFLLFNNEKMAKSLGNFFTLRDLVLRGFKPSSIRFLLASVPYRTQLNFTFDDLQHAAAAVDRLRNFQQRLTTVQFPEGTSDTMSQLARTTEENLRAGMEDDLNTSQAQAAIFEMIRTANAAMDSGTFFKADVPSLLAVLQKFDDIFSVLKDDDAAKVKAIVDWAQTRRPRERH